MFKISKNIREFENCSRNKKMKIRRIEKGGKKKKNKKERKKGKERKNDKKEKINGRNDTTFSF